MTRLQPLPILVLALGAGCAPPAPEPTPFDAEAPGPRPFAPHLWEPGEEVHVGSFTGDGRQFYFFRKVGDEDFRIEVSSWRNGTWSQSVRLPFSTTSSDLYPAVSADGRRVVFTSYRPAPGDTLSRRNAYMWEVMRGEGEWGEPVFLGALSTFGRYHAGVRMVADGSLYYRVISRDDRATMRAPWTGEAFGPPERLTVLDALQSDSVIVWGAEPTPDERLLFLTVAHRNGDGSGFGAADIFVLQRTAHGGWSEPRALPPAVNTAAAEGAAMITPDGRHLIFSRGGGLFQISIAALGLRD